MHSERKQGFALIYSLIIGLLCVIICISILSLELSRSENINNYEKYIFKSDINKDYENKLLNLLSKHIHDNIPNVRNGNIRIYFIKNHDFKIIMNNYYIAYDNANDYFYIALVQDGENKIIDNYSYDVSASGLIIYSIINKN